MQSRPNVLILFTDQQRYDTVNKAGFPYMKTPNLDRLASEGCVYVNGHSTNPVCMPARHDLLTGLPARAHGYFSNSHVPIKDYSLPTMPRIFSENGYRTAAIGKLHHFPARMHHGYSELHVMSELPRCRQDDQYLKYLDEEGLGHIQNIHGVRPHIYHTPQNSQMDEKHHGSTWVAERSVKWLEENGDKPFFLFAGWISPHPPWNVPKEYQGIYSESDLPKPINVSRNYPFVQEECAWYGDLDSEKEKRKIREAYYSEVTHVDKNIGIILDYLEKKKLIDNTLIIFTSDHGEMLQDKGFYSKQLPYEGSVRVPFIVRYPKKFESGAVKKDFVDLFDVMPTCLDVCGLEYVHDKYSLIGESLCTDAVKRDRSHQISSFGTGADRWVMHRNEQYKYVYWYNSGTEEVYDMLNDPEELNNLINSGDYPQEIYNELREGAIKYEEQWGPEGMIVNDDFIKIDKGECHPSTYSKHAMWQNKQFQNFDERPLNERGSTFVEEIRFALKDQGKEINEGFCNNEWTKSFMESWKRYGGDVCVEELLFKKE